MNNIIPLFIGVILLNSCGESKAHEPQHPYCQCMKEYSEAMAEHREGGYIGKNDFEFSPECDKIIKALSKKDSTIVSKCSSKVELDKEMELLMLHLDGAIDENHYGSLPSTLNLRNGKEELVEVSISVRDINEEYTKRELEQLGKKLSEMCMANCTNKRTYIPHDLSVSKDEGKIMIDFTYIAKNDYGVEGKLSSIFHVKLDDLTQIEQDPYIFEY